MEHRAYEDCINTKKFMVLCNFLFFFLFFFFWPGYAACSILVPQPESNLCPLHWGVWSLNHWTSGGSIFLNVTFRKHITLYVPYAYNLVNMHRNNETFQEFQFLAVSQTS